MAEPKAVETIEVCLVAPAVLDSSSVPKSLPPTFFDLRWLRLGTPQQLYFYEMSAPEAFFHSDILPRLKHSLSLTVGHHFLPVAGTLTWPPGSPKPVLTYAPGDAVSLTVARSYADFSLLAATDNVVSDATTCHPLAANLSASHERTTIIAIQVTVFPNCGFSIGITVDHAVFDGQSAVLFLKSWAHICRSLELGGGDVHHSDHDNQQSRSFLPADLEPFYNRVLINDTAKLEAIFSNQWLNFGGPNNRRVTPPERQVPPDVFRGTFQLRREKLEKLKRLVKVNKNDQHEHIHVSTFSLTCAYTWICLVKAQEIKDNKVVLSFPVDCRSRLEPPLPKTYFGNCIATGYAVAERKLLLGEEGFSVAIKAITEAIKRLDKCVLDGAENWVSGLTGGTGTLAVGHVFPIAFSHRFGYYTIDFGWGQPKKVDVVCKYLTGLIILSDCRNGQDAGVEIGLVLKKQHMETFTSLFVEGLESL